MRFVVEHERGLITMTELCEIYDIARETGYYWLRRYQQGGLEALQDRNRQPQRHPNQTPERIEQAVLELRRAHMRWGPRKLKRVLEREAPQTPWPAASTIGAMLAREGLVIPRKKRRRTPPYTQPFASTDAPNQVWCADFKGWFRTRDGERVDPLTITDAYSRYLLRCQHVAKTNGEQAQAIFEAAFRQFGLPQAIRTDNGPPFASRALVGLSRLAVWWMKLGIVPERIAAGHPEQNGRHERMHRTLKQETASPPASNLRGQQRAFNRFVGEYNQQRPHEALGMQTPSAVYTPSPRPYPLRVPEPEYGNAMQVRRVGQRGVFYWKGEVVFLSETLIGEAIGLLPENERIYTVYFVTSPVARFDSHQRKILPLPAVT
jgi:putative transposase